MKSHVVHPVVQKGNEHNNEGSTLYYHEFYTQQDKHLAKHISHILHASCVSRPTKGGEGALGWGWGGGGFVPFHPSLIKAAIKMHITSVCHPWLYYEIMWLYVLWSSEKTHE